METISFEYLEGDDNHDLYLKDADTIDCTTLYMLKKAIDYEINIRLETLQGK